MSCHKPFSWASEWCLKCFHSFCAIPASPFLLPVIPPVVLKMSSLDASSCSYHKNTRKHIPLASERGNKSHTSSSENNQSCTAAFSPSLKKSCVASSRSQRKTNTSGVTQREVWWHGRPTDCFLRAIVALSTGYLDRPSIATVLNYLENHGTQHWRGGRDRSHLRHLSPDFP